MINPLHIINNLFEMQAKTKETGSQNNLERNFTRLFNLFEEDGFIIQDPTGEAYSETRTDCEASISGRIGTKMKINWKTVQLIFQQLMKSSHHFLETRNLINFSRLILPGLFNISHAQYWLTGI